jgi:hypothetical protein
VGRRRAWERKYEGKQGSNCKSARDKEKVKRSILISRKYRVPDAKCVFFS